MIRWQQTIDLKELADILYAVYGTILEHGLQDIMEEVFAEVHRSNMSKEYHEYKMIKGPGYTPADTKQIFDNMDESKKPKE